MQDYSKETTEDLLNKLVSLGGIHQGLYDFEMEEYRNKIKAIKTEILKRINS